MGWWIDTDSGRETMLRDELQDICGQEAAREIMKLVNSAVDAIAQKRAEMTR